ncbi:MAG: DUF521 domain-containing protein [Desulfobacteraceae bacterium]|nr:DUF521 domain-containing protein [Desulfobacteraceae bacterium]
MYLTDDEKYILDGKRGEAERMALSILVELGRLHGAQRLIPVSQVHIDATLYMVDAGIEFAEFMAGGNAKTAVPTSLNPSGVDLTHWQAYRVPPDLLEKNRRLERAYMRMGAAPTWTCAPYQQGLVPRFGEHIAWGESNAIAFANSVLGARTNRIADLMDICAAVAGKTPEFGLHLSEHRRARVRIDCRDFSPDMTEDSALYPLLGYTFGKMAGDRVAALTGLPPDVSVDALKSFSAAAASSGAVGLFHLPGITPEARNLEMCFHGKPPEQVFDITADTLRNAAHGLWTLPTDAVDWIVTGCPHYSFAQCRHLARLMSDKKIHSSVVFWVFTSRMVYALLEQNGILAELNRAGIDVFTDGCPLQYPKTRWHFTAAVSDSAKFTHYCRSQTGLPAGLLSIGECVETAVSGRIQRKDRSWR